MVNIETSYLIALPQLSDMDSAKGARQPILPILTRTAKTLNRFTTEETTSRTGLQIK
jgi:hypothetical protein